MSMPKVCRAALWRHVSSLRSRQLELEALEPRAMLSASELNIAQADVEPSAAIVAASSDSPIVAPLASTGNYFYTSGNQILNSANQTVKIAGVNWFGFETTNYAPHGLWTRGYKDMMNQMVAEGFNTIRLPFSDQLFDAGSTPNGIDFSKNPDLVGLSGLGIMDKIVDYAGQIGLRILLDHHRSEAGSGAEGSGLWYTSAYPESRWISDWTMLAQRYAGNGTVIGADLHNEPHGAANWGNGDANDWRLAAERAGNAILGVNSNWLIVVEGVETGSSGSYWWGGNLSNAGAYPVRLNVSGRLVYSPHDYPASVYQQSWFSAPNYPANLPSVWDANWGYLFRQGTAPVLLGEFGTKLQTTSDQLWFQEISDYLGGDLNGDGTSDLTAGQQGMSWTYWSWNPNSGDTGGILQDDWTTVWQNKVNVLQPIEFTFPTPVNSAVIGRKLFYNQSGTASPLRYDGNNAAINANDDLAIATDKAAYLPGSGAATFANVSSYTKGINGIMVDLAGPHGTITADDFIFQVGNNNAPSTWSTAPAPISVSVRAGAGVSGSDRVEIVWANGAIHKQWLEVIVKANANTGLPQNAGYPAGQGDIFFFGSAPGDTGAGDTSTQANVSSTDELGARNHGTSLLANIPITNIYDFNRDGQVNTTDSLAARNNTTSISNVTRFITVASPPAAPEVSATAAVDAGLVAAALTRPSTATVEETPARWHWFAEGPAPLELHVTAQASHGFRTHASQATSTATLARALDELLDELSVHDLDD